jgi:hypothetical protein
MVAERFLSFIFFVLFVAFVVKHWIADRGRSSNLRDSDYPFQSSPVAFTRAPSHPP